MSKLVNENGIVVVSFIIQKSLWMNYIMTQFIMNIYFIFQLKLSTLFKKYDLVPFDVFSVQLAVVRLLCFLVKTNYTNLII